MTRALVIFALAGGLAFCTRLAVVHDAVAADAADAGTSPDIIGDVELPPLTSDPQIVVCIVSITQKKMSCVDFFDYMKGRFKPTHPSRPKPDAQLMPQAEFY